MKGEKEMSNYVTEDFTEEFMESLSNEWLYLIGGECGSGKTTAIMEKLVPYAAKNNKSVLYVCNRTALKDQLKQKYKHEDTLLHENPLKEVNDNLTIGMYQSITTSLEHRNMFLYAQHYDYVILDEAHLIYDASDYDINAFMFLEYLNQLESVIIALSGTPKSVIKMKEYLSRNINVIREVDKTNNPIRNIYLVENRDEFETLRKKYLDNGYKWFELVSKSNQFIGFKNSLKNYEAATILSNSNPKKNIYMTDYDELILNFIVEEEELMCDALAATKVLDVGVNINAHENFVVAFDCVEIPNTLEQFRSRIRVNKNKHYHVDLIFYVQKPPLWIIKQLKEKINDIEQVYKSLGDYETIVREHKQVIGERFRESGVISERKYNPITKKLLNEKLTFYKAIYDSKNVLEYYREMLKEMYPCATVTNISAVKVVEFFEELFQGKNVYTLDEEQKDLLKAKMKEIQIDRRHSNEVPSLLRINNYLKKEQLPYVIKSKKTRINGNQKRVWQLLKYII
ncbi:DEAD/DEAH box helicase family protein [Viridibacillus arvi]|nr:DEAD/DEAH box helicase family protein [Viridibacillus arvi]